MHLHRSTTYSVITFAAPLLHPLHLLVVLLPWRDLAACAREHRSDARPPAAERRTVVGDSVLVWVQLRAHKRLATAYARASNECIGAQRRVGVRCEELGVYALRLVSGFSILQGLLRGDEGIRLLDDASRWSALFVSKAAQGYPAGLFVEFVL